MKKATFYTNLGPSLPVVLRELVSRLVVDDWMRYETTAGFYYVAGITAHEAERSHTADFLGQSIPPGRPVSVVGEHEVHAQVASSKSAAYYLRQARSRLEASGIEPALIDRFLDRFRKGDLPGALEGWKVNEPGTDRLEAFSNFLHAMALQRGVQVGDIATEPERKDELGSAIEKVHLEQLARLFEGIIRRAGSLEPLAFDDSQLNEASRCYLYGFFRATVVLSATAVEKCLREAVGESGMKRVDTGVKEKRGGFYALLVQEAVNKPALGLSERMGGSPVLATYSLEIFELRNKVVHKGVEPQSSEAEAVVTKARQVVEFVQPTGRRS